MLQRASISLERPPDRPAILRLNREAFGGEGEAELIERLGADGLIAVSLVAEDEGRIIGHILLSWLGLEMDGRRLRGLALAPMAVAPGRQCQGTGSRLVEAAIEAPSLPARGRSSYSATRAFTRAFGFSPQTAARLAGPFTGEAFMALELIRGALAGQGGSVLSPAAFGLEPHRDAPTSL